MTHWEPKNPIVLSISVGVGHGSKKGRFPDSSPWNIINKKSRAPFIST